MFQADFFGVWWVGVGFGFGGVLMVGGVFGGL